MTIAELRELVARATKQSGLPWAHRRERGRGEEYEGPQVRAQCTDIPSASHRVGETHRDDDAALIAAAVNHLGPLLDLWEAAEKETADGCTCPKCVRLRAALARLGER